MDRRAAMLREQEELHAVSPDSVVEALSLVALAGRLVGWPLPEDEVNRRGDDVARQRWRRLRERWRT